MRNKFGKAEPGFKYCNLCGEKKPEANFYRRSKDGTLASVCRECMSRTRRVPDDKRKFPPSPKPQVGAPKVCKGCGVEKPWADYYIDARNGGRPHSFCKPCLREKRRIVRAERRPTEQQKEWMREYGRAFYQKHKEKVLVRSRAWYERNKESVNARARAWQKSHPEHNAATQAKRRAKAREEDSHTPEDIRDLMRLQRSKCAVCGEKIAKRFHVDHIVPLSRGGGNERANIQLLCPTCNLRKSAKDPVEFMQQRGFLL